jgi:hypothetical protein
VSRKSGTKDFGHILGMLHDVHPVLEIIAQPSAPAPDPMYHMTVWDGDRNSKGYYWGFGQVAQYLKDNPSHSVEVELMPDAR